MKEMECGNDGLQRWFARRSCAENGAREYGVWQMWIDIWSSDKWIWASLCKIRWGSGEVRISWLVDNIRWRGDHGDGDGPHCLIFGLWALITSIEREPLVPWIPIFIMDVPPGLLFFVRPNAENERKDVRWNGDLSTLPLRPLLLLCLRLSLRLWEYECGNDLVSSPCVTWRANLPIPYLGDSHEMDATRSPPLKKTYF
jgi:hypothetical protein